MSKQIQTEMKEIEEREKQRTDECIDAFEGILNLSELLPLVHKKKMSVEDVIRELMGIMPEGWVYTEA